MTDGYRYNQFDVNRQTHEKYQSVLRQLSIYAYEFAKFLGNFLRTLIKEVTGR